MEMVGHLARRGDESWSKNQLSGNQEQARETAEGQENGGEMILPNLQKVSVRE